MFCKWCGSRIENAGVPCPHCGKKQEPLENGNGFWDLCDKKPEIKPSSVNPVIKTKNTQQNSDNNLSRAMTQTRKGTRTILIPLMVITILLSVITLIFVALTTIRVNRFLNDFTYKSTDEQNQSDIKSDASMDDENIIDDVLVPSDAVEASEASEVDEAVEMIKDSDTNTYPNTDNTPQTVDDKPHIPDGSSTEIENTEMENQQIESSYSSTDPSQNSSFSESSMNYNEGD